MQTTVNYTIPWGEGESTVVIEVGFRMSKFVPAKISGDPDSCHEADGGELDILWFAFVEGEDGATLTAEQIDSLYETDERFQEAVYEDCERAAYEWGLPCD